LKNLRGKPKGATEKEVAVELSNLDKEIKKYDIEELKSEIVLKMNTIFTELGRSQK